MTERCVTIRIYGIVQGVGFRPFVSRLADRLCVRGSVANRGSYVEIHAVADAETLLTFRTALKEEAPPRSAILRIDMQERECFSADSFAIIESEHETGDIFVSPDIATCDTCARELYTPGDPRYLHPFINCTACGPRVTILDAMPYDRERTSMAEFPMCQLCHREYHSPESRRYDAQPVCCNQCGPELYLAAQPEIRGSEALRLARLKILEGGIVGIKGIGGFHLACNAFDENAVSRLRQLKRRPVKPFAVMMRDVEEVRRQCILPDARLELLTGPQKPIMLLQRASQSTLAPSVAPDNPTLGVMLPYAPVQMLLFRSDDELDAQMPTALVMTSGNVSGAPICRSDEDALQEIRSFCDLILSHNRKIRLRADDSVMDFLEDKPYMIRRSRGYAPLPIMLSGSLKGEVLGIGGELKNTFCPGKDGLLYPSPYIGDMADLRSVNALRESVQRLCTLLEIKPSLAVCDLHPGYNTSAVAAELGIPLVAIQHHYAHILSCMAENDWQEQVIGISFDGTGYGEDGSIWGGEILRCSVDGFVRLASVAPFLQPGGDASSREGWRIAASIAASLFGDEAAAEVENAGICTTAELKLIRTMAQKRINTVVSTSAGRLFDAAAAIAGICRASSFEGEAAMKLQFAAQTAKGKIPADTPTAYQDGITRLNTPELFRQLFQMRRQNVPAAEIAWHFHASLAAMTAETAAATAAASGIGTVAISGGVMQNTLLAEMTIQLLRQRGLRILRHSMVPPNDGGICLGQAAYAMHRLNR